MLAADRFSEARHLAAHRRHALVFRPLAQPAVLMAAAAAGVALLVALALIWRGLTDGVTFAAFLSYLVAAVLIAVAAVAGYWAVALANLRYEIVDGALIIVWGLTRQVIPLANIERLVRGRALGLPRVEGLSLPGWPCHVGRAVVLRLGEVLLYSTHRTPADILYVVTPRHVYGISPTDQRGFIQALQAAVASVDAIYDVRQEVVRLGPAAWPLWTDRFALFTLTAGAALALAATGVVFARYTALPAEVVLPFPEPGSLGDKRALLGIPVAALTVLLLNAGAGVLLHRVLRPVAYTLLLSTVFIEVLLLIAALTPALPGPPGFSTRGPGRYTGLMGLSYDAIVVGGGPAGSTAARELAAAGARVLLLERAAFPRDKPCGGGVNLRAARLLPFDLSPVVERTIRGVRFSLHLGQGFTRRYPGVLTYMTRRSRLDHFLVERAVAAGAELREREPVRAIDLDGHVTVRARGGVYTGAVLVGADGANGVTAALTGLSSPRELAVALEANLDLPGGVPAEWHDTLALDLGGIPGGYGWVFPKGDHLNLGVGGWKYLAGSLRPRLERLARAYGFPPERLRDLRGHHLPVRRPGAPIARGRVLLVGDAAGLVDPLSGEGIYAAILSGRLAARHALAALDGRVPDLTGYQRAVDRVLGPELRDSSRLQDVFHLMPPAYVAVLRRSDRLWWWLCRIIRGEETYCTLKRRAGPFGLLIDGLSWATRHTPALGRRAGLPSYRTTP